MKPTSVLARCREFIRRDVWTIHCGGLPWFRRLGVYAVRLGSLVISGFKSDQCPLHAASLTFFSLMALIPVLALTLALARAFGGADLAKAQFDKQLDGWMVQIEQSVEAKVQAEGVAEGEVPEELAQVFTSQVREISDKLFAQLDQLKFGTLGGIGAVLLFWTVIGMLGQVESSFNRVWGVEQSRPLMRKCADYLFVCLVLPFLVTAASSVPVAAMITGFMDKTVGGVASDAVRTLLGSGLFKLSVTLTVGTLAFAFLLGFMPNARVKLIPALTGGFVTVVLFGGWLKLCAMLQIGIGRYSTLYGSFAVLPILLLWVCTSWQIILLGAEIAFAVQNCDTYVLEQNAANASLRARLLLALTLCAETARRAREKEGGPFAAEAFARRRGIPVRFVKDILEDLVRNGILAGVAGRPGEYLLARCGGSLTVADVTKAMLDEGEPPEALGLGNLSDSVLAFSGTLDENIGKAFAAPVATL
jgi:membrane protein